MFRDFIFLDGTSESSDKMVDGESGAVKMQVHFSFREQRILEAQEKLSLFSKTDAEQFQRLFSENVELKFLDEIEKPTFTEIFYSEKIDTSVVYDFGKTPSNPNNKSFIFVIKGKVDKENFSQKVGSKDCYRNNAHSTI